MSAIPSIWLIHGPNSGADTPLVWYEGPTMSQAAARMLSTDLQGSVTSVTDFNGNPIAINRYDEYGRPQAGNVGRFQYTGQAWLPEIGLYYYKARMYSPTLGRFMQTDPIGYADGVNWYNYVGGDPVNGVDPSGLEGDGGITVDGDKWQCRSFCHVDPITVASFQEQWERNARREDAANQIVVTARKKYGPFLDINGDATTREPKSECDSALLQDGAVFVDFGNVSLFVGLGVSGSAGYFRNLKTGTNGFFLTPGGGWGLQAGIGMQGGLYSSLSNFVGFAWSASVAVPVVSGSANFSADGTPVGLTAGPGAKLGASFAATSTILVLCNFYE